MSAFSIDLPSEADTKAFGEALGERLRAGDVVCLTGALGAGKTTLARGAIKTAAGETDAPSPTFALVETYQSDSLSLHHFDLYRLQSADDVYELGLEEAMQDGACLIEWPEKIENMLPESLLIIHLKAKNSGRIADIRGLGAWVGRARDLQQTWRAGKSLQKTS